MSSRPSSPGASAAGVRAAASLAEWCAPFRLDSAPARLDAEDWSELAALADRHKVTALVAARTSSDGRNDEPPPEIADRFAAACRAATSLYRARTLVIAELLEAFDRSGVRPMLLKGQSIAERFYDPAPVRLGRDIDVLVRADEMRAAESTLAALGYSPVNAERYGSKHFHQPWRSPRRVAAGPVEVHWDVVEPDDPVQFDLDGWWRDAAPHRFHFGEVLLPPLQAEIAYVTFHALQHGTATLRDLADVSLLCAQLADGDRERLEALACQAGCSGFLDVAAWLVSSIWGDDARRGPLIGRRPPGRLSRALFDPERLVRRGPEERWARMELARWSCLPRDRAGLGQPFRRAITRHRQLAASGAGKGGLVREARVAFVLAANLARAAARS